MIDEGNASNRNFVVSFIVGIFFLFIIVMCVVIKFLRQQNTMDTNTLEKISKIPPELAREIASQLSAIQYDCENAKQCHDTLAQILNAIKIKALSIEPSNDENNCRIARIHKFK